jgi:hypothetical protein
LKELSSTTAEFGSNEIHEALIRPAKAAGERKHAQWAMGTGTNPSTNGGRF